MAGSDEAIPSLLDAETVRHVLRLLEATDVDELEITHGRSRLYLRRDPTARTAAPRGDGEPASEIEGVAISAPLTGIYYPRPSPEEPAFVTQGGMIEPGQIVALIETMKLFNEVTAELAGEVLSILVQHGDLVEAGQPLMYVRPREEGEQA